MGIARGLLGSALAAALGAGLWIGIFAGTGYSVGLLAIAIGGLAGFGMAVGCGGRGGATAGILAALVTLVAICGARLTIAEMFANEVLAESREVTEADVYDALGGQIFDEFLASGTAMSEPRGEDFFPPEVIAAAERRWRLMSQLDRDEYFAALVAQRQHDIAAATPMLTGLAFVFSFGIIGLVMLGLSMSTAYKIASTVPQKDDAEEVTMDAPMISAPSNPFARLGPPADPPADAVPPVVPRIDRAA